MSAPAAVICVVIVLFTALAIIALSHGRSTRDRGEDDNDGC